MDEVCGHDELHVVQRRELAELIGLETRNKYELRTTDGAVVGFAAEQGRGALASLARYFLGHWREFEILVFDAARRPVLRAFHPFRWFFQRLEVSDAAGRPLGAIQQRWGVFTARFDVEDASGRVVLAMSSGLFRPWTFPFFRDGAEVARVEKKWSGLLTEAFTDGDRFRVVFGSTRDDERALLLAAAIFTDLQYFEKKADG
jgi:uncharacterized protein YxjI